MKHLALILAICACTATTKPAPTPPTAPKINAAVEAVIHVDKHADCVPLMTDVGEHHAYSAVCTLSNNTVVNCIINDQSLLVCGPPGGETSAKNARAKDDAPPPAPPAPAVHPAKEPPAKR